MEVHAHSHTPRKKWTHYFWEFLMLFLAVFAGFLAENQREHMIEHQRERKYMKSLLNDLREDSYTMDYYSSVIPAQINGLDSLISALRQPLSKKRNINSVYLMYIRYGQVFFPTEFTEGTTTQLKNAGGLRMIRKDSVVYFFNSYEAVKGIVKRNESLCISTLISIEQSHANHLLDLTAPTIINSMINDLNAWKLNTDSILLIAEKDNPVILKDFTSNIDVFRNNIKSLKSLTENYLIWLNQCNKLNKMLQASIQKEYHLK